MLKTSNFIVIVALLVLSSCGGKEKNQDANNENNIADAEIAVGLGRIIPKGGVSNLAASSAGIVSEVLVHVGDSVKKGDVLIRLHSTQERLSAQESSERVAAQSRSVEASRILLKQGEIQLAEKERKLKDMRELMQSGAVSRESVAELENEVSLKAQELQRLNSDLARNSAQLSEYRAQQGIKNNALSEKQLTAPTDGILLEIMPRIGEAINLYSTYAKLAPAVPLIVEAEIDEMMSGKIQIGQECDIHSQGSSTLLAKGKIISISPDLKQKSIFSDSGQDMQDRRVRIVNISIDNSDNLLIDTKVECIIHLK